MKNLAVIALLLSTVALVPTAAATPPRDGFGFAFSDDGQIARNPAGPLGDPLYGLGDDFARLRSRAFRFTVPYNAVQVPAEIDRAKAIIDRVKEVGVQQILVSFRQKAGEFQSGWTRPDPATWRALVRAFMDQPNGTTADGRPKTIDDDVTMWSPAAQPNAGTAWLSNYQTGPSHGYQLLAGYYKQLEAELASRQSSDKLVSPEFHDARFYTAASGVFHPKCPKPDKKCSSVWNYIQDYYDAGGRFGDFLGWHPYHGVKQMTRDGTLDFLEATNSIPVSEAEKNKPVLMTAGWAFGQAFGGNATATDLVQHRAVNWLVDDLAMVSDRIARLYYYHGRQPQSLAGYDRTGGDRIAWESALVRKDASVRPAWYTWCAASHGGDANHPDCFPQRARWYVAPSAGDHFTAPSLWQTGHGFGSTDQFLADVDGNRQDDAVAYFHSTGCWHLALAAAGTFGPSSEARCGFGNPSYGALATGRHMGQVSAAGLTADAVRFEVYADYSGRKIGSWYKAETLGSSSTGWYFDGSYQSENYWITNHGQDSTDQFLADVTADGRAEPVVYSKSTGCWRVATPERSSSDWRCAPDLGSSRRLIADVTGDRKADAVMFFDEVEGNPAGRWYVAPSTGTGFGAFTQWSDGHGAGSEDQFLGDVNGDGTKDAVTYSGGCWHTALSLGNGFAAGSQWLCGHGLSSTSRLLGDVTGDGKADAVTFSNQASSPVLTDRTDPTTELSGSFIREAPGETISGDSYPLHVDAVDWEEFDGELPMGPFGDRAGVKSIEIKIDGQQKFYAEQACAVGNCDMARDWSFRPADYPVGIHSFEVRVTDHAGNVDTRGWDFAVGRPPAPLAPRVLSLQDDASVRIDGAAAGDRVGHDVAYIGDINEDALGDYAVGAPAGDRNGRSNSGSVYIIYGGTAGPVVDLAALSATQGFRIDGAANGDFAGTAVRSVGDVNGDGLDDLAIGAPRAAPDEGSSTRGDRGAVYVVFGRSSPPSAPIDLATLGTGGFRIDGPLPDARQLVAAFGFDEGSGSTVADASGAGNGGTIAGASWAMDGKFGKALSFDGDDDMATVPDSASLDLTSGMTLEAWVKPDIASSWRTVLLKEKSDGLAYALYGHTSSGGPNIEGKGTASSSSPLPTGSWSHLAGTYDGSKLRLYVNGELVTTVESSGSLDLSSGALQIGANTVWGFEDFDGLIDEVRIYSRALSASDIQADMAAPVSDIGTGLGPRSFGSALAGESDELGGEDFNADGRADVVIGSPSELGKAGAVYVVFGTPETSTVDTASLGSQGYKIDGSAPGDHLGYSVAIVGDMSGDELGEVVATAPGATPVGRTAAGAAWVMFGKGDPSSLSVATPGSQGFQVQGAVGDRLGSAVAELGDLNRDGAGDIVLGGADATVLYGKSIASPVDLGAPNYGGYEIASTATTSALAVAAADDVNGDALPDVLIGDPSTSAAERAGLVYGTQDHPQLSLESLGGELGRRADSGLSQDAGLSIASVEDTGPHGEAVMLVGAPLATSNGRDGSGSAYLLPGPTQSDCSDTAPSSSQAYTFYCDHLDRRVVIETEGDPEGTSVASVPPTVTAAKNEVGRSPTEYKWLWNPPVTDYFYLPPYASEPIRIGSVKAYVEIKLKGWVSLTHSWLEWRSGPHIKQHLYLHCWRDRNNKPDHECDNGHAESWADSYNAGQHRLPANPTNFVGKNNVENKYYYKFRVWFRQFNNKAIIHRFTIPLDGFESHRWVCKERGGPCRF